LQQVRGNSVGLQMYPAIRLLRFKGEGRGSRKDRQEGQSSYDAHPHVLCARHTSMLLPARNRLDQIAFSGQQLEFLTILIKELET
jgi:hypothetical protein